MVPGARAGEFGRRVKVDRSQLEALLEIVRAFDLDALTVRDGTTTYELVARAETAVVSTAAVASPDADELVPALPVAHAVAAYNAKKVTAPIIGVFYRSPAPGTESFVEVGDRVEVGQALCILEAMKLMNEITSDFAGIVRRILPENGALVSLGEELFWIEP